MADLNTPSKLPASNVPSKLPASNLPMVLGARSEPRMTEAQQELKRAELMSAGYVAASDVPISDPRIAPGAVLEFGSKNNVWFVEVGSVVSHPSKKTVQVTSKDYKPGRTGAVVASGKDGPEIPGTGSRHTYSPAFVVRRVWARAGSRPIK